MKEETLKAQGSPSWLMPPWFKNSLFKWRFFFWGRSTCRWQGEGCLYLLYVGKKRKRKQLTHDYYYYYFKMRSEIITLWYGLGSSFLKLRNIPFTLVKVVS